ncbi:hydroxyisourate hydrolase [Streptomyces sp. NPDC057638]|uniref:hydroxyisourate hydrolase n=1 Tax=Streptomyces sp. NPDC057638 TaxID=3346190 RepID=UPI003694AED4
MSTEKTASVSTHVLDTAVGRPAAGLPVSLSARGGPGEGWVALGGSVTDADGRCTDLPRPPHGTTQVRLEFRTGDPLGPDQHPASPSAAEARQDAPRARDSGAFFPEVTVAFAVSAGEHYHVPLLLSPFGYSVYRGS